jgi:YhcH/YjgK/YiaL family protein
MLHAFLNDPGTYSPFLTHPLWQWAISWLRDLPADVPLGLQEIIGRDMYVSVQEYDTKDRNAARFESHRRHIDLQYTLAGTEVIDWLPVPALNPDGPFDSDKDFQFYSAVSDLVPTSLVNSTGRFAIFFPQDAHRPGVRLAGCPRVRKLVIKISLDLLESPL